MIKSTIIQQRICPFWQPALALDGINFSYSEDPEILANEKELQNYDGILLYANHDSITANQEAGLLNFIKGGKGFIPLHSASFFAFAIRLSL